MDWRREGGLGEGGGAGREGGRQGGWGDLEDRKKNYHEVPEDP